MDSHKTPIMFSALLTPDNYDHVTKVTTEELEKLHAHYIIQYPDFPNDWFKTNTKLLEFGARTYQVDDKLTSAAMAATQQKHTSVLMQMLRSAEENHLTIGINNLDENHNTVLMLAVQAFSLHFSTQKKEQQEERVEAICSLLRQGSDINLRNKKSLSALMLAVQLGNIPIIQALVSKCSVPIDYSICNSGKVSLTEFTLTSTIFTHHHSIDDENALFIACESKSHEAITLLLNEMPNHRPDVIKAVNQLNKSSKSPLSIVASLGHPENVEQLLQLGANPNNCGIEENPIINATIAKCFLSVQHLIKYGANVNATDSSGNSVLHYAVNSEKANIVKLLLEAGANPNAANKCSQRPLHGAIQRSKSQVNTSLRVERILLDFGADINATDILGKSRNC
jgi:ankyrin repeat protein